MQKYIENNFSGKRNMPLIYDKENMIESVKDHLELSVTKMHRNYTHCG